MLRFFKARFFGGLPAAQMEAPNIFAPSHAPNGGPEYFCGCTAHLPALPRLCQPALPPPTCLHCPASACLPCRRPPARTAPPLPRLPASAGGRIVFPARGGLPALPPLQVPREPTRRPRPPGGHLTNPAAWVAASPVGSYMPPVGRPPPTPPPLWGGSPFKIEDKQVSPGCAQR